MSMHGPIHSRCLSRADKKGAQMPTNRVSFAACCLIVGVVSCSSKQAGNSDNGTDPGTTSGASTTVGSTGDPVSTAGSGGGTTEGTAGTTGGDDPCADIDLAGPRLAGPSAEARVDPVIGVFSKAFACGATPWNSQHCEKDFMYYEIAVPLRVGTYDVEAGEASVYTRWSSAGGEDGDGMGCTAGDVENGTVEIVIATPSCVAGKFDGEVFIASVCPGSRGGTGTWGSTTSGGDSTTGAGTGASSTGWGTTSDSTDGTSGTTGSSTTTGQATGGAT